jgi:hypothetical protein
MFTPMAGGPELGIAGAMPRPGREAAQQARLGVRAQVKEGVFFQKRTKKLWRPHWELPATSRPTRKSLLLLFFRKEDLS